MALLRSDTAIAGNARYNKVSDLLGQILHTEDKPYECDICKKRFILNSSLVDHRQIHSSDKSFVCQVCDKVFERHRQFVGHTRTHTGERQACDTCSKSFKTRNDLRQHQRLHLQKKPLKPCVDTDSQQPDASVHTDDEPFVSIVSSDPSGEEEESHEQSQANNVPEKPFVCIICQKRFKTKACLTKHRRIHTGEKPYVCRVCNKSFSRSHHLVEHSRIHSGERPFSCVTCRKLFSTRSHLKWHQRAQCDKFKSVVRKREKS